jgi:GH24 family phage-related lysozyme (muramidase)
MANSRVVYATVAAIAIAVPAEGIRQIAYGDIAQPSLLTVCYGETHDVVPGKVYSIAECKAMLNTSMQQAVETVEKCRPGLPVHTLAAFADAVYNMGPTVACDTRRSTAARMLADGRIGEACMELLKWTKARVAGVMVELPGLKKRRRAEVTLCMRGLT